MGRLVQALSRCGAVCALSGVYCVGYSDWTSGLSVEVVLKGKEEGLNGRQLYLRNIHG